MHFSEEIVRRLIHSLDLTEYEARAYLSLVEHGPLTARGVSEASGIPRPKCYDVLKSLQLKGLVSRVLLKPINIKRS
jgi:sugar-specific transcriptional regulator TrmB